ncbi:N-acetyllactosaminide beta-1,3-N-acetylglucosaminyltransferase 2 [Protopterus annectens]|uniref:N-acetyllactosaminide beta-1,3-N-acetylglucosaminyltransferase 2 n=1 Tax=Protopterus annectens TaxID=7888 RepID=UPI001CFB711F|nr:N-acetyllactosaminide beta-1,3-N-acetylglucosaminyltransferase 2 [Protopterus annectens]XP_043917183.1 N-acetyllactosaminide beta-1,3-N-acetylglucosaminyltransferase 2 [Protopterus annectens]
MNIGKRRLKLLLIVIAVNFVVYLIVEVSRGNQGKDSKNRAAVPTSRFWKSLKSPKSTEKAYWNREQQKLEDLYNPILALLSNTTVEENLLTNASLLNYCEPDFSVTTQVKDFQSLPERFKDFLLYLRCRNYSLVIDQPDKCSSTPLLLLAIKSLIPHFDRRQAIRESWGREMKIGNVTVVRVFLLGQMPAEDSFPNLSDILHFENEKHKDILLWDFKDTFFNLTLKEVLFLKWVTTSCPNVKFIFKGDDDVFVNTYRILEFFRNLSNSKAKHLFMGDVIKDAGPHREKKLKYYIPESLYEGTYPPYAGGGGVLYSGEVAHRLYNVSQQVLLYPIDDVYIGMCLRKLGFAPEKHKGFKTFGIDEKYRSNICVYRNLMLVHSRSPQEMITIWSKLKSPDLNC